MLRRLVTTAVVAALAAASPVVAATWQPAAVQAATAAAHPRHLSPHPTTVDGQRCVRGGATPYTAVPWQTQRLATSTAWLLSRGAGVTVAVIDSGVDVSLPQLRGAVTVGPSYLPAAYGGSGTSCDGHGTLVAGLIAARPRTGTGIFGVAPAAHLLSLLQTTSIDRGSGSPASLAAAIRYAVTHHATVINVSVATTTASRALRRAVADALHHDVVVVAAAGNVTSTNADPVTYPASYPGVLAVAATDRSDAALAQSDRGSWVGVAAPGDTVIGLAPGRGEREDSGTSFSAALVSGLAALVRSRFPRLTAAQVVHRIEVTADHPADGPRDDTVGYGVVNPYAAVSQELPEESGATRAAASPGPLPAAVSSVHDTSTRDDLLLLLAAGLSVTVLVPAAGALVARGRQRRWRPAR